MNRDDFLFRYLEGKGKSLSWLDVGAGDGLVSRELERLGCGTSTRIDLVPGSLDVQAFDGKSLNYPRHSFDYVLFNFVLHHAAENAVPLLRQALTIAKSEVLIQEDIDDGDPDVQKRLHDHDPNGIFYSEMGWMKVFQELGSEVVKYEAFPRQRVEDHPQYDVPRAFISIRAKS